MCLCLGVSACVCVGVCVCRWVCLYVSRCVRSFGKQMGRFVRSFGKLLGLVGKRKKLAVEANL